MLTLRPSDQRGRFDFGWLDTRHTFSFGEYHDPAHMGFRALRVINEDRVAPGGGFPTHPHRDMEILTYVVEGALEHRDSLGNGSVIRRGDIQRMTAGTGVRHSEQNASSVEPVRFLQIWVLPAERGLAPGYAQRHFDDAEKRDQLRLVASPDGGDGSVSLHQDVRLYAALLAAGTSVAHPFAAGRHGWVQLIDGRAAVGGVELAAGDGVAVSEVAELPIIALADAELLLFDLG
jgi:redox-sensitive bicupin YhaK (pirin superfamily)